MLEINHHTNHVSVVIATLGGNSLIATIEQLNLGTLVPSEILVCIPELDAFRVAKMAFQNVKIVVTEFRGQVAQRAIGFQKAVNKIVLQIDDDVILHKDALYQLTMALRILGGGNVVAPLYYDDFSGHGLHGIQDLGYLRSWIELVIYGAPLGLRRMGKMTQVGFNYGVDNRFCGDTPFETQWLPGGCVLSFHEDLIKENFFPFEGKAYCEDLINSFLREKKGIRHWVIPSAKCSTGSGDSSLSQNSILDQMNARRYFVKLSGRSVWRLNLYIMIFKFKQFLNRLKI